MDTLSSPQGVYQVIQLKKRIANVADTPVLYQTPLSHLSLLSTHLNSLEAPFLLRLLSPSPPSFLSPLLHLQLLTTHLLAQPVPPLDYRQACSLLQSPSLPGPFLTKYLHLTQSLHLPLDPSLLQLQIQHMTKEGVSPVTLVSYLHSMQPDHPWDEIDQMASLLMVSHQQLHPYSPDLSLVMNSVLSSPHPEKHLKLFGLMSPRYSALFQSCLLQHTTLSDLLLYNSVYCIDLHQVPLDSVADPSLRTFVARLQKGELDCTQPLLQTDFNKIKYSLHQLDHEYLLDLMKDRRVRPEQSQDIASLVETEDLAQSVRYNCYYGMNLACRLVESYCQLIEEKKYYHAAKMNHALVHPDSPISVSDLLATLDHTLQTHLGQDSSLDQRISLCRALLAKL